MAENSKIEWTEATWNPIAGCSVVSPGCTNCYAMRRVAPRLSRNPATPHYAGTVTPSKAGPVWTGEIGLASDEVFTKPLRWKTPRMIFVNSTSDLFHEKVPDEVIDRVFAVMAEAHWHTYQVLTKRSKRMHNYLSAEIVTERIGRIQQRDHGDNCAYTNVALDAIWPLPNVWLGVSAEDQKRADERIPDLLATPAAIRFVSAEPLLEPLSLERWLPIAARGNCYDAVKCEAAYGEKRPRIDWVIVGGESGRGARDNDFITNARSILAQCKAADVPFFGKQNVEKRPLPADLMVREWPEAS
ncbi:MAG TPA: phage Gp37/Gp68 family protein [Hyphomicrobiaceae bacterium]